MLSVTKSCEYDIEDGIENQVNADSQEKTVQPIPPGCISQAT
jgi:hypothetical protein